jgi:CHAT domain-containing protein
MEFSNRRNFRWLLIPLMVFSIAYNSVSAQGQLHESFSQTLDSAEILKLKGQYDEAIAIMTKVKDDALLNGIWDIYARSLIELADVWRFTFYFSRDMETIEKAFAVLDQAYQVITEHLDTSHMVMLRYYIYKGKLFRDQSAGGSDSLSYYLNKSWNILEMYPNAHAETAKLHYESGFQYNRRGLTKAAEWHYDKLLAFINRHFEELDYFRGYYLHQAGTFYFHNADYEKSLLCSNLALHIFQHPKHQDKTNSLSSQINIANSYFNSNIHTSHSFLQALSVYKKVYDASLENQNNFRRTIITLSNMGACLYELEKYDSCYQTFKKVISMAQGNNEFENTRRAKAYLFFGLISSRNNNPDQAAKYYKRATDGFLDNVGRKDYEAHVIFRVIGKEYLRQGNHDLALRYFQEGLISLFEYFNSGNIYENPRWEEYENIEPVLYILFDKAGALYTRFLSNGNEQDLRSAFEIYEQGYDLIQRLLDTGMMNESFVHLFQNFKDSFQTSVECALTSYDNFSEKGYLNASFNFMEQSKYFLLLKSQQSALLKEKLRTNSDIFLAERTLNREIDYLKHQLNSIENNSNDKAFNLRNILLEKIIEKSEIWTQLKSLIDTTLTNNDRHTITLDDVQNDVLKNNEIIVEYYRAEKMIYALVIGKLKISVVKIPVTKKLTDEIWRYAQALSEHNLSKDSFVKFTQSSYYLYQTLFEPIVIATSSGFSSGAEINYTIVTDGELAFVPFEAFTTAQADTSVVSYWGLPYLCKDYIINYAYSLNIQHKNVSNTQQAKNNKILAMSYSGLFSNDADIEILRNENELPYSGMEIEAISNIFHQADYEAYQEATEDQFKSFASGFSIIHLAIHGKADTINRYDSRLLFKFNPDSEEDGQLHAYELYNIDLSNNQLAVLSACETGLGRQIEGEGLFSIARGFAYAGCPAMVMSLWKVNDKSTAMLMKYFYENLSQGMNKDKALQQAKLSYIKNTDDYNAHPANWAAFIAMGNNRPIELKRDHSNLTYTLLFVLAGVLTLVVLSYRRNALKDNG